MATATAQNHRTTTKRPQRGYVISREALTGAKPRPSETNNLLETFQLTPELLSPKDTMKLVLGVFQRATHNEEMSKMLEENRDFQKVVQEYSTTARKREQEQEDLGRGRGRGHGLISVGCPAYREQHLNPDY